MKDRETLLCENCLEQIFHPVCTDCLEGEVVKWLRSSAPFMIPDFKNYSQNLKEMLLENVEEERHEDCTICGEKTHIVLCTYCYIREAYHYLRQFSSSIADEMTSTLDFDFENMGYFKEMNVNLQSSGSGVAEKTYAGICDACENFSHGLVEEEGEVICEECRELR